MRRRKRRRTMRPPASTSTPLCINGVCAVRQDLCPPHAPARFSDEDKAQNLKCADAGLLITYNGAGKDEKDAASVRTDTPIPTHGLALYYFEVTVVDAGEKGRIGVGLCNGEVHLEKMPGWESGSYAYHGDDGLLFRQNGTAGNLYGPKYTTDDVIGCCWDLVNRNVFFTKNGKPLGTAFEDLQGPLYPTVGMQTKSGCCRANFGRDPFVFDIEAYAQEQRDRVLTDVMQQSLPADYRILSDTVLSYLIHSGYAETAASFAKDAGREAFLEAERGPMLERRAICEKVLTGDIEGAIRDLDANFPSVLHKQVTVRFLLRTQKFIELIVSGASVEETVEYGKRELSVFRDTHHLCSSVLPQGATTGVDSKLPYAEILTEVWSLLAYVDPAESPNGHLVSQSRREMVAEKVNSAILAATGRPMRSILERFISQSEQVLCHVLKDENGPSALITVQDVMK